MDEIKRIPISELLDDNRITNFGSTPGFTIKVMQFARDLEIDFGISGAAAKRIALLVVYMQWHNMLPKDYEILKISNNRNKIHFVKDLRYNVRVRIKVNIHRKTRKVIITNRVHKEDKILFKPLPRRLGGYELAANWSSGKVSAGLGLRVMDSIAQINEFAYGGNTLTLDALVAIAHRGATANYKPIVAGEALITPGSIYNILPTGTVQSQPKYSDKKIAQLMCDHINSVLTRNKLSIYRAYIVEDGTDYVIKVPNIFIKRIQ